MALWQATEGSPSGTWIRAKQYSLISWVTRASVLSLELRMLLSERCWREPTAGGAICSTLAIARLRSKEPTTRGVSTYSPPSTPSLCASTARARVTLTHCGLLNQGGRTRTNG